MSATADDRPGRASEDSEIVARGAETDRPCGCTECGGNSCSRRALASADSMHASDIEDGQHLRPLMCDSRGLTLVCSFEPVQIDLPHLGHKTFSIRLASRVHERVDDARERWAPRSGGSVARTAGESPIPCGRVGNDGIVLSGVRARACAGLRAGCTTSNAPGCTSLIARCGVSNAGLGANTGFGLLSAGCATLDKGCRLLNVGCGP